MAYFCDLCGISSPCVYLFVYVFNVCLVVCVIALYVHMRN